MSRLTGWTIAFALLIVGGPNILAGVYQADGNETLREGIFDCALTQCLVGRESVLGAPFSAEATTEWRPPADSGQAVLRAITYYYRDGAGRVRVEQHFAGHQPGAHRIILMPDAGSREVADLVDPAARPAPYLVDPAARTFSRLGRGMAEAMIGGGGRYNVLLPRSMTRSVSFFQVPAADEEPLGQRSIAGIQATGTRFATATHVGEIGHAERWVSPELQIVVYSRGEDSCGTVEHRLTRITRAEPPADLFEMPAGYVETPIPFPLVWEHPNGHRQLP
jgi:hypothetical protein